ncbi:helix-turn-helix domain-containing protein [Phyllobacterium sp. LjRoot231]|uniref:helix-turn-helix domain-containing protein n=1 Tax=Phyllobacterium sp. LjRoot231 TaxID=3342289 RepID=UPI003ED08EE0
MDERRIVAQMLQAKARLARIASVLGRSRSAVHREIKRNWWHDKEVPQTDGYWHVTAQNLLNSGGDHIASCISIRSCVVSSLIV